MRREKGKEKFLSSKGKRKEGNRSLVAGEGQKGRLGRPSKPEREEKRESRPLFFGGKGKQSIVALGR